MVIRHEQCHETLVENLRYAVDKLASHGIKLVLEAINTKDIPRFLLTTRQVLNIIHDVNHPDFPINTIFIICKSWKGILLQQSKQPE